MAAFALCAALLLAASLARAQEPPRLSFPVECETGSTCMVQNYFDHDPGPGTKDYRCGFLTYDGHDGTDIRLPSLAAMDKGFRVLAAAEGRVRAVRDGMADAGFRDHGRDAVKGREAGNGVALEHGDGWETLYGHMRRGSVLVKPGDTVKRGQPLGLVGLSGWTEFPHLHLTVRHRGRKVDPFIGLGAHAPCSVGAAPLWDAAALEAMRYVATGLLAAGFAGARVSFADVKAGRPAAVSAAAPALVFWVSAYGVQAGDEERLRVTGPDGRPFADSRHRIPGNKAEWFAFAGRKRSDVRWPAGVYSARYTLTRGASQVLSVQREATIR